MVRNCIIYIIFIFFKDRCEESHEKYGCVRTDKALPSSWVSELTEKSFKLSGAVWQNVNFHKIFFPGTSKKFSCPENQELVSTFYMFPENATMDVSAAEELVIAIDDEVGVVFLYQSFSSVSF